MPTRIQTFRAEAGESLRGLARKAGIDPAYLQRIERGHAQPSVTTLRSIARALNRSVADLLADEEEAAGVGR